ncbi:MAG TPA: transposase [Pyrinomonadaceae bacterium]|nr:transposase [Pyrinomonadaceae bacterium]
MNKDPRYWHSRGYLPHFDADGFTQFITFRLADSVPQKVLEKWRDELSRNTITNADFRRRVEFYLDQNCGSQALVSPAIAELVQNALLKLDGEKYRLISWVIMPNHAHVLLAPVEGVRVSGIMHSIKSFTSHGANRMLGRTDSFWAKEYFDRYIRDQRHFASTVAYIENNPVKARLCRAPAEWPWSSAHLNQLQASEAPDAGDAGVPPA